MGTKINYEEEYKSLKKGFDSALEDMTIKDLKIRKLIEEIENLRDSKDDSFKREEFYRDAVERTNNEINELKAAIINLAKKL